MSLITIQSQRNNAGDGLEHGYIQNHFTQPIIINPGDTISLVNLTMTKVSGIEISGSNDTLIWRFGNGLTAGAGATAIPPFQQHIVKLAHGTYTVDQLVAELQVKLQESVKIGCFAPQGQTGKGFIVDYNTATTTLSITMDLSVVPAAPNSPFGDAQLIPYINGLEENTVNQTVVPFKQFTIDDGTGNPIPPTFVLLGHGVQSTEVGSLGGQFTFNQNSFFDSGVANALSTSQTGIFCNGGTSNMICQPNRGQRRVDATATVASGDTAWGILDEGGAANNNKELVCIAETSGGGGIVFPPYEWLGNGNDNNVTIAAPSAAEKAQGWDYKLTFADPVRKFPADHADNTTINDVFLYFTREYGDGSYSKTGEAGRNDGVYRMGSSGAVDASLLASWDMPYNAWVMVKDTGEASEKTGFLVGLVDTGYNADATGTASGFFARSSNISYVVGQSAGSMNLPHLLKRAQVGGEYPPLSTVGFDEPIDYNPIALGYMRNDLYEGKTLYPDLPDNQFDTVDAGANGGTGGASVAGADILAEIIPSFDGTQVPLIQVSKTTQTAGTTYLSANWRTRTVIFGPVKVNDASVFGASFTPPNLLKLSVEITGISGVNVKIGWAASAFADFSANEKLLVTTQSGGSPALPKINSTIKERWFPLRPAIGYCTTSWYYTSPSYIQGEYDTTLISGNGLVGAHEANHTEAIEEAAPPHALGAPSVITLRHMWKFGQLQDSDVGNLAGQIPANQREPNTANVATTLSFPSHIIRRNQAPTDAAIPFPQTQKNTGGALLESGESPNLSVEVNDFNVKGYNGATSDINKQIAVITREELATGETTGSLHYVPPYPIKIDLNVPSTKALNSLTVALRDVDSGQIVNELSYPTTMTLLHEKSEMTKMEEMMSRVMMKSADRNNAENSLIGMSNPRV